MSDQPLRLAIASRDDVVVAGLRRMLGNAPSRVLLVEEAVDPSGAGAGTGVDVDVVLHDGDVVPAERGSAVWVPIEETVAMLLALVESSVGLGNGKHGLTEREAEILDWIAQGLSNQEIAERAYVSINSVKTYIRSAYRKIGVRSRSQAVAWGVRRGLGAPR